MSFRAALVEFGGFVFNDGPLSPICAVEGWHDGLQPEVELMPAGGRLGAVLGNTTGKERLYTLVGQIDADPAATFLEMEQLRARLLAAFPLGVQVPLHVTTDIRRTAWVTLYDKPEAPWAVEQPNRLHFTIPVVAADPLKYHDPVIETMGAFLGSPSYRQYAVASASRAYTVAGAFRTYIVAEAPGAFPEAAVIENPGTQISRRLSVEINGPLDAGDWIWVNETTGQALWVDVALQAGQILKLDAYRRTATIGGISVDQHVYGDWPHLAPGSNTFRLSTGTANNAAFANVTAYPADL